VLVDGGSLFAGPTTTARRTIIAPYHWHRDSSGASLSDKTCGFSSSFAFSRTRGLITELALTADPRQLPSEPCVAVNKMQ
jgi:hypothetical protein